MSWDILYWLFYHQFSDGWLDFAIGYSCTHRNICEYARYFRLPINWVNQCNLFLIKTILLQRNSISTYNSFMYNNIVLRATKQSLTVPLVTHSWFIIFAANCTQLLIIHVLCSVFILIASYLLPHPTKSLTMYPLHLASMLILVHPYDTLMTYFIRKNRKYCKTIFDKVCCHNRILFGFIWDVGISIDWSMKFARGHITVYTDVYRAERYIYAL